MGKARMVLMVGILALLAAIPGSVYGRGDVTFLADIPITGDYRDIAMAGRLLSY